MGKKDRHSGSNWLAWGGWRMRIPPDWRPLKIDGGCERGAMMIGDGRAPVAQVKWSRPGSRTFDPRQWARKRLSKSGRPQAGRGALAAPEGFEVLAWLPDVASPKGLARSLWYGYSAKARLLMEIVVQAEAGRDVAATMVNRVLPSVRAYPPEAPVGWAVFKASFRSPPGFDLRAKRFNPGHMCLLFGARRGGRLLVRQIYPIELALAKRDLAAWLRSAPFPERRRFYPSDDPAEWSVASFGRRLTGIIRRGRKRLPWPLGWAGPRWTVAAAVRDPELDRLLSAEHDSAGRHDDAVMADAIGGMNWASLQSDGGG